MYWPFEDIVLEETLRKVMKKGSGMKMKVDLSYFYCTYINLYITNFNYTIKSTVDLYHLLLIEDHFYKPERALVLELSSHFSHEIKHFGQILQPLREILLGKI